MFENLNFKISELLNKCLQLQIIALLSKRTKIEIDLG